jgi:hypothetical protein
VKKAFKTMLHSSSGSLKLKKSDNLSNFDEGENIPMINLHSFDLEEYAAQYPSNTMKVKRLMFIADSNPECSENALNTALIVLRDIFDTYGTMDFNLFEEIHQKLHLSLDRAQFEQMQKKSALKMERLTTDLANSRHSQIHESIRVSFIKLNKKGGRE